MSIIAGVVVFLCITWAGLPAGVAQEIVEPTDAQQALNDEGVRALIEGDFSGAVALLERSTRLGPLNITYLNLGRAYQRLGQCDPARAALEKVEEAPAVAEPPPAEVEQVARQYLEELAAQCDSGESSDTEVAEETDADPEPDPETDNPDATAKASSDGTSGDHSDGEGAADGADAGADTFAGVDFGDANWLAWGTTASGLALVGSAVALHLIAERDRGRVTEAVPNSRGNIDHLTQAQAAEIERDADRLDTVALGLGIGGALLTGAGIYFFVSEGEPEEGISINLGANDIGVVWSSKF